MGAGDYQRVEDVGRAVTMGAVTDDYSENNTVTIELWKLIILYLFFIMLSFLQFDIQIKSYLFNITFFKLIVNSL